MSIGLEPVFLLASIVSLGLAYRYYIMGQRAHEGVTQSLQALSHSKDQVTIQFARNLRHNFINDLQVISGWLQLRNLQRAEEYIIRVREKMARESELLGIKVAELAAILVNKNTWAEANGVEVNYNFGTDLAHHDRSFCEFPALFGQVYDDLLRAAFRGQPPSGVHVAFYADGNYYRYRLASAAAHLDRQRYRRLVEEVEVRGGRVKIIPMPSGGTEVEILLPVQGGLDTLGKGIIA